MTRRHSSKPTVSVVASVCNLADGIADVVESLAASLRELRVPFEMVFVDDASTDGTWERLVSLSRRDRRLRLVRMRASFGEAAALDAGFRTARGGTVLYVSGRVRVNAGGLPALLRRLDRDADFVVGRRFPRRDSLLNRAVSRAFNVLARRITAIPLRDINSGVFATRREVLERIPFYGDLINFLPVLVMQQGYRVVEEDVEQLPGSFRLSKYPKEYVQRFLDIVTVFFLTRYSKKPIHFMGFVGAVFAAVGLAIEGYLFVYRILGIGGIAGRPLLVLGALLLVIGIQMVSIGLIGEMIIFTHAGDIKEYNIEETIN
jgi:glycosyltransferase involved in cell wall biosynthesis